MCQVLVRQPGRGLRVRFDGYGAEEDAWVVEESSAAQGSDEWCWEEEFHWEERALPQRLGKPKRAVATPAAAGAPAKRRKRGT